MIKALVIGWAGNESHDNAVRDYYLGMNGDGVTTCDIIMIGSGSPSGNIIAYVLSLAAAVQYAIDHSYKIIMSSYSGVYSHKIEFDHAFANGIIVVHAHGSNTHERLESPPRMFSVICVGGGRFEGLVNERSYGMMECFSSNNDVNGETTYESWATPTVAGNIAAIFNDFPLENLFNIRAMHRQDLSNYATGFVEDGGYGYSYGDSTSPDDVEIQPPLEFWCGKDSRNSTVTFLWEDFNLPKIDLKTKIFIGDDNEQIYLGIGEQVPSTNQKRFVWNCDRIGTQKFTIVHYDTINNVESAIPSYNQITLNGLEVYIVPEILAQNYAMRSGLSHKKFI